MALQTFYNAAGKGYGAAGASRSKRSVRGYREMSGSPREDIDYNNYTLRQRGRLMYMNNPIAASGVKTHRTNTIGLGLKLNPRPDIDFLGMTTEEGAEWVRHVKREFSLWAEKKESCDSTGMNDFYEMQQMLLTSWLSSGDVFVLIQEKDPTLRSPYRLRLKAVEADRIATPNQLGIADYPGVTNGVNPDNGNRIWDGVEVDQDGMAVAYWIRNTYPYESINEPPEFVRVQARGDLTDLPNIIQIINTERPDQYRGVTFLAPIIIQLLQVGRYTEAELTAAVIESMFTGFVKTTEDASEMPMNEAIPENDTEVSYDPNDYEMGPGTINVMNPGEDVVFADPKRPASGFQAFVDATATQMGAALEIPRDILLKTFNASYSASRGALLEAWKSFMMYRQWFVTDFCTPVYELWMHEAVATGRISAPGFFTDPAIRSAWLRAQWIGPSQGTLNPVQEIQAEIMSVQNGFTTREDASLRVNGSDFDANVDQLTREQEKMSTLNPNPVTGTNE